MNLHKPIELLRRTQSVIFTMVTVFNVLISTSRAEVMIGQSAEWLTVDSSLIALIEPLGRKSGAAPRGHLRIASIRCRTVEVFKGPLSRGDEFTVYDFNYVDGDPLAIDALVTSKNRLLVFCKVADHLYQGVDGKFVFTEDHVWKSAFVENAVPKNLYTPEGKRVSTFSDLCSRMKSTAAKKWSY